MAREASLVATGCLWFLLLTICGSTAWSQEGKPPNAPAAAQAGGEVSARLHEIFFRKMSAYDFFLDAEKQKKLILRREPVLRYPASPTEYCGEIYVWTERGRAAVIGCVFAGEAENATYRLFHEFHSLTMKPLVTVGGDTRWQPEEAGIEFKRVPDKAEPDKNKARRLTEMWRIARRFDASMIWKNMGVNLRLLPQPLYRYELSDEDSSLVDGAVFAFAHKELDDPEVLLVLEARRMGNETHWHYAPARLTDREAWVKYEGKEIWRTSTSSAGIFDGVITKRYGVFIVKAIPREVGRK